MSQQNVEIVRNTTDSWNSGGVEALLPFYCKDVVWYAFPDAPDYPSEFRGHDGIRELAGNWTDSFDDFTLVAQEIRDLGDTVVALGEVSAKIKGSNTPVHEPFATVNSDFRGGKIGQTRFFQSWEEALEAVGVSEQDVHADS
jgi:ketosteroid isomerase-like protein